MIPHQSSMDTLIRSFSDLGEQAPSTRTKIGILRSLYPHIESAKRAGYSYSYILDNLIENGFCTITPNHFYGLLNRLRLECGSNSFPERPAMNNQQITCGIGESSLYSVKSSKVQVNVSSQSRFNPPTVEEMKLASATFDIDSNEFD